MNPNSHSQAFNPDDQDAREDSINHQWESLKMVGSLPNIDDLDKQKEKVAETIADYISTVRKNLVDKVKLKQVLVTEYDKFVAAGSPPTTNKFGIQVVSPNVALAEHWLDVTKLMLGTKEMSSLIKAESDKLNNKNTTGGIKLDGKEIASIFTSTSEREILLALQALDRNPDIWDDVKAKLPQNPSETAWAIVQHEIESKSSSAAEAKKTQEYLRKTLNAQPDIKARDEKLRPLDAEVLVPVTAEVVSAPAVAKVVSEPAKKTKPAEASKDAKKTKEPGWFRTNWKSMLKGAAKGTLYMPGVGTIIGAIAQPFVPETKDDEKTK